MGPDSLIKRRFQELEAKAAAVSRQRVHDFTSSDDGKAYYKIQEAPAGAWATNVQNLLQRVFGRDSVHYTNFTTAYERWSGWESGFETLVALFDAAREDYEGGYLFSVRALAKAEVLSDSFAQSRQLLAAGYKDPASVLARVALESALKELCDEHGIVHGKLDKMNADLCKAGVYNMAKQKQITAWADIGNKAAHGDWSAYSEADARSMLDGVEGIVADLF
jgi:hypothetical protein